MYLLSSYILKVVFHISKMTCIHNIDKDDNHNSNNVSHTGNVLSQTMRGRRSLLLISNTDKARKASTSSNSKCSSTSSSSCHKSSFCPHCKAVGNHFQVVYNYKKDLIGGVSKSNYCGSSSERNNTINRRSTGGNTSTIASRMSFLRTNLYNSNERNVNGAMQNLLNLVNILNAGRGFH